MVPILHFGSESEYSVGKLSPGVPVIFKNILFPYIVPSNGAPGIISEVISLLFPKRCILSSVLKKSTGIP